MIPIAGLEEEHRLFSESIYNDSRYPPICQAYCRSVAGWFRSDLRRLLLFGDFGREMTVVTAYAKQGEGGVTLSSILSTVTAHDFASMRRVRAICAHLEDMGVVRPVAAPGDRRQRPLRFGGGWFDVALLDWLLLSFRALAHWMDALPDCSLSAVARLFGFTVDCLERLGLHPVPAWPAYRVVRDHMAGFAMIAELIGGMGPDAAFSSILIVSRKALASAYGISRIHVASLINLFERLGWLFHPYCDGRLAFVPESLSRLRLQIARELAWVGLAFGHVGDRPPGPAPAFG